MTEKNPDTPTIRQASTEDLPRLMRYVETEWKSDHIFAHDAEFFRYEYQRGEALNFIISENSYGDINGMLGYLASSSAKDSDVWTTMWKVSRGNGNPLLGVQLLQYLKSLGHRTVMSLGINKMTIDIYRYLGYSTGTMHHHFLPNRTMRVFQIARIPDEILQAERAFERLDAVSLRELTVADIPSNFLPRAALDIKPRKDLAYVKRRYFNHPRYRYRVHGIEHGGKLATLLVSRVVQVGAAAAWRIADIIGVESLLPYVTYDLYDHLVQENLEYLDLVSFGLDEMILFRAGLSKLDLSSDQTVIPNYFQPFTQKNIAIHFFVDGEISQNLRLFKADGDQDRPS